MDGLIQIKQIKGVGPKKAERFARVGIKTFRDAVYYFPKGYQDRSVVKNLAAVADGERVTVGGIIESIRMPPAYGMASKAPMKLMVSDGTARAEVVFFNAKYLKGIFAVGEKFWFYGAVRKTGSLVSIQHPEYCKEDEWHKFQGLNPLYPLTDGLTQNDFRSMIQSILDLNINLSDILPERVIEQMNLLHLKPALEGMHRPPEEVAALASRRRFAFEELYLTQLALLLIKRDATVIEKRHQYQERSCIEAVLKTLPYQLTQGQQRVLDEIVSDMQSSKLMNRLVQGDVGSGKTVLAMTAAYYAAQSGYQTAIMAPTEILARQHYAYFSKTLEPLGVCVELLVSNQKDKNEALERIQNGAVSVVIGTHALIQKQVMFKHLALVVTDEQHRFGVRQRSKLAQKAEVHPDVLFMSATPIPRTLSLILYGDVDVSFIDEMPVGRLPVKTHYVKEPKRQDMYQFIKGEVAKGHQAYFVCPLISDSEEIEAVSAETHYASLKNGPLKGLEVGLIHGQMKGSEKEQVMERFVQGEIGVLVSTTVIEVGVNVPNATIMVIEDCQRFGLAQLHQLRGRVGRGAEQSWCFLTSAEPGKVAKERIQTLCKTYDGLVISQKDLELRGPGEILGTRQHGIPELRVANLIEDHDLLEQAQKHALEAYKNDSITEGERQFLARFMTEISL